MTYLKKMISMRSRSQVLLLAECVELESAMVKDELEGDENVDNVELECVNKDEIESADDIPEENDNNEKQIPSPAASSELISQSDSVTFTCENCAYKSEDMTAMKMHVETCHAQNVV